MKTRKNEDAMGHDAKREQKEWKYRRGDIYLANLNPFKGSEQGGKRPVLVIQNNAGNRYSSTVIIAAISIQPGRGQRVADALYFAAGGRAEDGMHCPSGANQDDRQKSDYEVLWQSAKGTYEGNKQNYKDQPGNHTCFCTFGQ